MQEKMSRCLFWQKWDKKIVFFSQVPESFGPIRTIAEGRGETVLIGTTKNFVLQGSLDGVFIPITQVDP